MKQIIIAVLLLFAISGYSQRSYDIRDIRVIDGDTIRATLLLGLGVALVDTDIRLSGIDAPEKRGKSDLERQAALATEKYLYLSLIIAKKVQFVAADVRFKDKYGRFIGVIIADGINVNERMIELGLVRAYSGDKRKPWTSPELVRIIEIVNGKQN